MRNLYKIKSSLIIFCIIAITGCVKEEDENLEFVSNKDIVIDINTTRTIGNILGVNSDVELTTRKSIANDSLGEVVNSGSEITTRANDPFTEIREVECFESVVLPELQPHIWIGNVLTKSSVVDCNYNPLIYPRNPITISATLPGTNSKVIDNASYSKYLAYIQEQTSKGTFSQNGEFNFTTEQFTSYNELKVAFGSNVSTGGLFWKSSTTTEGNDHTISKATGLYVKFYQTSFKVVMDYPQGEIASIPSNLVDEAVYVNSITYGRLGILTIETNEAIHNAEMIVNKTFRKLFVSGSSNLTTEEQAFLDGCDFRVYLIGGNGSTSVETFKGYSGFIQHIKKGTFSQNEPGAPLFCTFNHVKNNSPVSVKFKYSIKKEPVYLELKWKMNPKQDNFIKNKGDLIVNFYRNSSKIPTIAPPHIKIKLRCTTTEKEHGRNPDSYTTIKDYEFQNAGYKTSMALLTNVYTTNIVPSRQTGPPWDREMEWGYTIRKIYLLQDNNEYTVVGYNPIDEGNAQYAIP